MVAERTTTVAEKVLAPGTVVAHYKILRYLGRGHSQDRYLAFDRESGEHTVLAIFFGERFPKQAAEQFAQTVVVKGKVESPFIVPLRQALVVSDHAVVAFAYEPHESLRERMRSGLLGLADIDRIGLAVTSALADAQGHDVLHLDLTPESILIAHDGTVRVRELGIGKLLPRAPAKGEEPPGPLGSPEYLAPEQFKGEFTGSPADIWAFGVILYELVSGIAPYLPKITQTIAVQVINPERAPRLPPTSRPVSAELVDLIGRCLQKQPAQRPLIGELVKFFAQAVAARQVAQPGTEPFQGLAPFSENDSPHFFGRDAEVDALFDLLQREPRVSIVGHAASGKTSLVAAGLTPRLRPEWLVITLQPGHEPFFSLAAAVLANEDAAAHGAWAEALLQAPEQLALRLEERAAKEGKRLLLVVDSLEELLAADAHTRSAFLSALDHGANDRSDPVRIAVVVREEFTSRFADLGAVFVVRPPDKKALLAIVERTLATAGATFDDPSIAGTLIDDVAIEPTPLPLLEFALTLLWAKRDPATALMRRADFDAIEGAGALAQYARAVTATLTDEQKLRARDLLFRLVDSDGVEHPIPRDALLRGAPDSAGVVLDRLLQTRILVMREGGLIELASGALMLRWPELVQWLGERSSDTAFINEVNEAAATWQKDGAPANSTWQGGELHTSEHRLARSLVAPSEAAKQFISAGRSRETRRMIMRRGAVVVAWVLLAITAAAAVRFGKMAFDDKRAAESVRDRMTHEKADAQLEDARAALQRGRTGDGSDLLEARAQIRGALEVEDSPLARAAWSELAAQPLLWRAQVGSEVPSVALSGEGQNVAAASGTAVVLLDARTGAARFVRGTHEAAVTGVAFTSRGPVSVDRAGKLVLHGTEASTLGTQTGGTTALAASAQTIATCGKEGLTLWPVAGGPGKEFKALHAPLSFSADGKKLAVLGDDHTVHVLDTEGATTRTLPVNATAVAFSADGAVLAAGTAEGEIKVFALAGNEPPKSLRWHQAAVTALYFSANGLLASGSADRTIAWGPLEGPPQRFRGHRAAITSLSGAGALLVSGSSDGSVRMWNTALSHGKTDHRPAEPPKVSVATMAFGNDGSFFITGNDDGSINLWDVASAAVRKTLTGHEKGVLALSVSPDGRLLASASADGTTRLWDLPSGAAVGKVLTIAAGPVKSVRVVDRKTVITGHADGKVRIWVIATAKSRSSINAYGDVALAISADGKKAVTAGSHGPAQIWKVASGQGGKSLPPSGGRFTAADFSPDGTSLITGDSRGKITEWKDVGPPRVIGTQDGLIHALAFNHAGTHVATASADHNVIVWDLAAASSASANKIVLTGLRAEANALAFSLDGRLIAAADDDGRVRVWNAVTGRGYWRAPLLTRTGPDLLTQGGWLALGEAHPPVSAAWRKSAMERAELGDESNDGKLVCFAGGDKLELWDESADKSAVAIDAQRPDDLVATTGGCVTLKAGQLGSYGTTGQLTNWSATASALGPAPKGVVAIEGDQVTTWSASGDKAAPITGASGAIAVGGTSDGAVVGFADGSLTRLTRGAPPLVLASGPHGRIVRIIEGPAGTIAASDSLGFVGLWDTHTGRLLQQADLHARVTQLAVIAGTLYAASELGTWLSFDLATLSAPYCDVLKNVWASVPVRWISGGPELAPTPSQHPCLVPIAAK